MPNLKCHTSQLEQIGGWGEAEIQIDAPVQVGHDLAVERPKTIGRPRNPEIERVCTHPATHDALPRPPLTITVDLIGETCRYTFVLESGRALESPRTVSLYKPTSVMIGGVQTTPENRVYTHAASSAGRPRNGPLSVEAVFVRGRPILMA